MRVFALRADKSGCGFYRIQEPARVTAEIGLDVRVGDSVSVMLQKTDGEPIVREVGADADVLVVQRPSTSRLVQVIKQARRQGMTVVVELDDDLSAVHHNSIAKHHFNQQAVSHIEQACAAASWLTCSTQAIADRFAVDNRYTVLRNCVPQASIAQKHKTLDDDARLGWTGTVYTHPEDLEVAGAQIGTLLGSGVIPGGLSIVGDGQGVTDKLYVPDDVPVAATGWVDLEDYIPTLSTAFEVGMVPLTDSLFNEAKSALKGLEYASQGIPFVASPTTEYIRMHQMGSGLIARKSKHWQKMLKTLFTDEALYEQQSKRGLEIANHLTYEVYAEQWAEAWDKARLYTESTLV